VAGIVLTVSLLAAGDAAAQLSYGRLFMSPMGEPYRSETEPSIVAWFAAADADDDQRLSRAEFVDRANVFFTRVLDANQDGGVTSAESTAFWRLRAPEVLASRAPAATPRAGPTLGIASNAGSQRRRQERDQPRQGAAVYGILFEAEPVMSCDADMSRRVTAEEFQACANRRFDQIDVDGDGHFTIAESPRASELAGLE
jgi:hypothetical protein